MGVLNNYRRWPVGASLEMPGEFTGVPAETNGLHELPFRRRDKSLTGRVPGQPPLMGLPVDTWLFNRQ